MKKILTTSIVALGLSAFLSFGAEASTTHTVKSGDSYWKIGQQHGVSHSSIMNANKATSTMIYPGNKLIIPTGASKQVSNVTPKVKSVASKASNPTSASDSSTVSASAAEIDLLARLVRAEALGEPYQGKVAVAVVVLNRVESSQFPNSISSVIYQPGQFSPVNSGSINTPADSESIRAAKEALNSPGLYEDSLFFYNAATATSRWLDSRPTTTVIGNHTFKR